MIKTFITAVSLQQKSELQKVSYEPKDFTLTRNRKTSFPIIPIIAEYKEENEKVQVIVVRTIKHDVQDNFNKLLDELKEVGVTEDMVEVLPVEGSQGKKDSIRLLLELLDKIPEDSLVYADITFNTKPLSAMVLYAMNFVEKMKDTEVEGIYYGEIDWKNAALGGETRGYLNDLTMLKYLSDTVDQMSVMGISNIREALSKLVEL